MVKIREAAVAGMFYPADPARLRDDIARYLKKTSGHVSGRRIRAAVVPHAGYPYSGGVAADAYVQLQDARYSRIVLLGPSHRVWFEGVSVAPYTGYRTPLGDIPVDRKAAESLAETNEFFSRHERMHSAEHSLEVQLPWLQIVLQPGFSILPLLFGSMNSASLKRSGEILGELFYDPETLFLCSTDLSHDHLYDEAVAMDSLVRDALQEQRCGRLESLFASGEAEACGRMGLIAMLAALEGRNLSVDITGFSNSGDAVGDKNGRIVGYLSAVIREAADAE